MVEEVLGDGNQVTGLKIKSTLEDGVFEEIKLDGVFIAIGHDPTTGLFVDSLQHNGGYLTVRGGDAGGATATSVPGVFRRGRCGRFGLPPGNHIGRHGLHGGVGRGEVLRRQPALTWERGLPALGGQDVLPPRRSPKLPPNRSAGKEGILPSPLERGHLALAEGWKPSFPGFSRRELGATL